MDAIDILGGMLGHKSGGSGMRAKMLKDILGGGLQSKPPAQAPPASAPAELRPGDIQRDARELEDLLNVANKRHSSRTTGGPQQQAPQYQAPPQPRAGVGAGSPSPQRESRSSFDQPGASRQNEQALVLILAMVNAAKADGRVGQAEQESILEKVGGGSREAIQFLRDEFAKPLDVREFAWSVPLGMEQHVYTMSLTAIDLDTNPEAKYLRELAHGLRLSPTVCDQIHARLGAPGIFKNAGRQ